MKKLLPVFLLLALLFTACSTLEGRTEFAFSAKAGDEGFSTTKEIYVRDDTQNISFETDVTVKSGILNMEVVDRETKERVWNATFSDLPEGRQITLDIDSLAAGRWYDLVVAAGPETEFHLNMRTSDSLAPEPERPAKAVKS